MMVMLLWVTPICVGLGLWYASNRTDPDKPLLSERGGVLALSAGILIFLGGFIVGRATFPAASYVGYDWRIFGIIFGIYSVYGKVFRLVPTKR